jgi:excisionase family DNA binding protein
MRYTAGQAAKATGKSIPTITRAIAKGKLSAERTGTGGYLIDASELHRVFPALPDPLTREGVTNHDNLRHETPRLDKVIQPDVAVLSERLRILEEERERERSQLLSQVADLQARLDREGEERRALATRLLPSPASPTPSKRSWWLWGRSRG